MIDPKKVYNPQRNQGELEEFFVFCVLCAGKNPEQQVVKMAELKERLHVNGSWRPVFRDRKKLNRALKQVKMGQYKRVGDALHAFGCSQQALVHVTPQELETFPGVGPKTSRFFCLYTQENFQGAALDVHILRFLREELGADAPRQTPQWGIRYRVLEALFVQYASKRGYKPVELDYLVWLQGKYGASALRTPTGENFCTLCVPQEWVWKAEMIPSFQHYFPICGSCFTEHTSLPHSEPY